MRWAQLTLLAEASLFCCTGTEIIFKKLSVNKMHGAGTFQTMPKPKLASGFRTSMEPIRLKTWRLHNADYNDIHTYSDIL